MEDEDKRNKEFFIVGQAFLHTGINEVEKIIEKYIDISIHYNDSYTTNILENLKKDISKVKDRNNQEKEEYLQENEESIFIYSGKIIKIYDKSISCGFCIKKDYINNRLVELQGIYLDFNKSKITELTKEDCENVEIAYCEEPNGEYQIAVKDINNRDYGKLMYENIKNNFLVLKKDEVLER